MRKSRLFCPKFQHIAGLQCTSLISAKPTFQISGTASQHRFHSKSASHCQISSAAGHGKSTHKRISCMNLHCFIQWHRCTIQFRCHVGTRHGDHCRSSKPDRRSHDRCFQNRFLLVISHQNICQTHSLVIHSS